MVNNIVEFEPMNLSAYKKNIVNLSPQFYPSQQR